MWIFCEYAFVVCFFFFKQKTAYEMRISDWSSFVCSSDPLTERCRASRFSCNYHNWVYRNDGSLMGVPDEANFFDLDKKKCGLLPIATDVLEGWIFLNHQNQPEVSLQEFLGDFGTRFAGVSWENTDTSLYFEAHLDANWKVLADAFSETRSEEHTSELQSLMRISYAVFCL